MKTAILILAAGASSRMGCVKQLLPYQHTHLLGWTIEQALNTSTKVFCVLGANATAIEKEIPTEKSPYFITQILITDLAQALLPELRICTQKSFITCSFYWQISLIFLLHILTK